MTKRVFSSLAKAFEIIARSRNAERNFSEQHIHKSTLRKLLELSQLAPSSFNMQPYKLIVVSAEQRLSLSSGMLGGNADIVSKAPVSIVFLADKVPQRLTKDLIELELSNGTDPSYVSSLPAKISFLLGDGLLSGVLKRFGTHILSPLKPSPKLYSHELWSVKNTALMAQQLMLGAVSLGLSTLPMEGFDERRIKSILSIPSDSYTIPLIISVGYSKNNTLNRLFQEEATKQQHHEVIIASYPHKPRFSLEKICFENIYGKKMKF